MKKFIWPCLFLLFVGSQVFALDDIEITGEADLAAAVYNLPTSDRGDSTATVPSLLLDFNMPLKEGNLLFVSFEGAQRRDQDSKPFTVQTREAYLDLVSPFQGMHALRLGLIPQTWQEAQYEDWDYRFLGPTGWVITEKWKYLFYSDVGASFMSELPSDVGEWALSVVNGQGRDSQDPAPHKEAALFVRLTQWSPVMISLGYVRGSYEKYDSDVNLRERIQASMLYKNDEDTWRVGFEFLDAHDPADALTSLKMAEGVDVTAFTGKAVHGRGGSLFAVMSIGAQSELMARWDYLDAVVGESGKDLNTWMGSWGYQVTEDIKAAVMADYTKYGSNYGAGLRDNSKLEIAAQVLF